MFSRLNDGLWLLEPVLNAVVAVIMYRRREYRRLPLFFSYNVFQIIANLLLYGVGFVSYKSYFYAYWSTEPICVLLSFGIIQELFRAMFRHREGLKDFGTILFRWALLIVVLMGLVLASAGTGAMEKHQFLKLVVSMERSVQLMMLGLLLFLLAFSSHLGVTWRHQIYGITAAWGFYSLIELTLYTQHARMHLPMTVFNVIHLSAIDVMVAAWVCYLVVPEPKEVLPNMLLRSQRWNEALLETEHLDGQPTLLLGIESIVERAFTKSDSGHK
jgi:hypothetical protein